MTSLGRRLVWGNQDIKLTLDVNGNMEAETAEILMKAFDEVISRLRVGMTKVELAP